METVNEQRPERALLLSVDTGEFDAEVSMYELGELAKTAGALVCGVMIQKRSVIEGATYLGSGRLAEAAQFCSDNEIDLVIVDGELSPVQVRNIENITDTRVVDRTTLILDIFARRARTKEGKLQVELAQLKYSLPRLTGKGTSLSRLGGGIGTRGPGETKLESDRRHIRRRIQYIKQELDGVEARRNMQHERRRKNGALVVAIVGYTNAGKSTLMNHLTNAGVLEEDKLFATLDPTARKLTLPNGQQIMLVDTVGFISRLPHQLVDAFRSTLEEATYADVILNVCDASDDECHNHIKTTYDTLSQLFEDGRIAVPVINVFNKCDKAEELEERLFFYGDSNPCVSISALTGFGVDKLLDELERALPQTRRRVKLLLPFEKGGVAARLRESGIVHSQEYTADGILVDATADISVLEENKDYII